MDYPCPTCKATVTRLIFHQSTCNTSVTTNNVKEQHKGITHGDGLNGYMGIRQITPIV
jgi:hypothetical protein